ncbi:MAG: 2-C-methyl-D-erythritol 2,4-cyclodiphosphate synthase [Candidatus Omnitrophota bacterium]
MDDKYVNIKAMTNEGLGFIGGKQGIAAYATASLSRGSEK